MSAIGIVLVVILVCLIIGAWPSFGLHGYGPYPSGILGVVLLIVLVLLVVRVI